jgi:hypothetical protein
MRDGTTDGPIAERLGRDRRGAVRVESVVIIGTVMIGFSIAIVALGPSLVANYERSQGVILSPFP